MEASSAASYGLSLTESSAAQMAESMQPLPVMRVMRESPPVISAVCTPSETASVLPETSTVVRKADAITPVPGGVGIMTVTSLLENTLKAAELAVGKR